jgi:hypothetical protein
MNGKWNADFPDLPDLIMDQANQVYQRHQRSIFRQFNMGAAQHDK